MELCCYKVSEKQYLQMITIFVQPLMRMGSGRRTGATHMKCMFRASGGFPLWYRVTLFPV